MRTGDPEPALEQLRLLRASCLSALGRRPAEIQERAAQAERGTQVSDKRSALEALSAAEKAAVLDELLAARPDLREPAEAYAAQVMSGADRSAVADDVEDALQGLGIEELNTPSGPGMAHSFRPRIAPPSPKTPPSMTVFAAQKASTSAVLGNWDRADLAHAWPTGHSRRSA